jgi:hypothetical protein
MGTNAVSSPPSAANWLCAKGKTPRTRSVKVWARRIEELKSDTGKLYSQG